MDSSTLNVFDHRFEYHEMLWGDLIYGTEAQLRALGFTCDFPDLTNKRRARRSAFDPRGFECKIEAAWHNGGDIFSVSIPFPERKKDEAPWRDSGFQGVCVRAGYRTDDYSGDREALERAGLVPEGCFPGDPGMRKVVVKIFADGTLPTTAPTTNLPRSVAKAPGARDVRRAGVRRFEVSVYCAPDVVAARHEAIIHEREAWEAAMCAMPRPSRLDTRLLAMRDETARERRGQLRVVWSMPRWKKCWSNKRWKRRLKPSSPSNLFSSRVSQFWVTWSSKASSIRSLACP